MKTKREIGNKLEQYVAQRLREVFNDNTIRPTKNSGASTQLADIYSKMYLIECKKRNTESITINEKVWLKLLSELPINSIRIPLYVLENKNNRKWAVLDFEDFIRMIK